MEATSSDKVKFLVFGVVKKRGGLIFIINMYIGCS